MKSTKCAAAAAAAWAAVVRTMDFGCGLFYTSLFFSGWLYLKNIIFPRERNTTTISGPTISRKTSELDQTFSFF